MQLAAASLNGAGRPPGDQTPEYSAIVSPSRNPPPRPDAASVLPERGAWREVMVMGIHAKRLKSCPCQANTDIDHPDEALLKGISAQGKPAGGERIGGGR